ncbi:Uu.00g043070.m01.CDS01 [Anthostomella pinea]|uniref:Uu.00g043070.m01.CDS01 n=1 Tax=Anthostomella pinea TaxID=933095 RepID=A0AAI8VAN3_9PEZI|nr:Uu.00g043070.m01.CDS01 [Anthostomella pinea]
MLLSTPSLVLPSLFAVAAAYRPCPILGPVFEKPTDLCDADIFQAAIKNLTTTLGVASKTAHTRYGSLPINTTSFSIGMFDAGSTLFSYQYSSPALEAGSAGVKQVTEDSVYRIGSGSKLITVYLFLIEVGAKYWNHPITEFVPQLADAAKNCSAAKDPVDCTDWNDVTLGALASHMAGMPADYSTQAELLTQLTQAELAEYGLPHLPASTFPPCGWNYTDACVEQRYLSGYTAEHPIYAPFTTHIYSNGGFELLEFALENITGISMADMVQKDLFGKLGMTHSSYNVPSNLSNAVMPLGAIKSGFVAKLGDETAVGGFYTSQSDYVKMGQSILSATLLSPNTIRQWMKPVTFVSNGNGGVGMPWEIWGAADLTDRVVDMYTKSGDVFSYSSMFVLIPDYNVGFVVHVAGDDTTSTAEILSGIVAANIVPALENTARAQSQAKFAGTYSATAAGPASNITLSTEPGTPDWQ